MAHKLMVNPGTPQAWEIPLKSGPNRIGRNEGNDFQITHSSISSSHCEITVNADGSVVLKDLGSTNGTFIDRNRVTEVTLQPGQHLQLGAVDMILEFTGETAPVAAPSPVRLAPPAVSATPPAAHAPMRVTLPTAATAPPVPAPMRLATAAPAPATPQSAPATASPPIPPPVTAKPAGLRLSGGHAPTSAAVASSAGAAEAPPLPVEPEPLSAGEQYCKFHPKTPARFYCPTCRKFFCDLCVGLRGNLHVCRACASKVTPVIVNIPRPQDTEKGFFASIPGAFVYPFRGFGIFTLLLATVLIGGDEFLSRMGFSRGAFGWIIRITVFGFVFLYLQNIIHTTTSDEKEPLGFPEVGGFFGAAFQLGMTALVSFSIVIALTLAAVFFDMEIPGAAMIAGFLVGCLYFPMAFLAVAMKDSVLAVNPLVVIPAILKIPKEYLVAAVLLMVVYGLRQLGQIMAAAAGEVAFSTRNTTELGIALIVQPFLAFVGVYLLTVSVRILGILYNRKKHELGWFNH